MKESWPDYFRRMGVRIAGQSQSGRIDPDVFDPYDLLRRVGTPADATVRAAQRLLAELEPDGVSVPLANIRMTRLRDATASCHGKKRAVIFINPESELYRAARAAFRRESADADSRRKALLPLAAVLYHEHCHALGSDEPQARAAEAAFLEKHS